jgi:hypothetical protein
MSYEGKNLSKGKIVGGILGFVGGWFILFFSITYSLTVFSPLGSFAHISGWIWNLMVAILAIVGSILGFMSKKPSGPILLAAGLLSIVLGIIYWSSNYALLETWQYSYFTRWGLSWPESNLFLGISIEALLITIGGVICLLSESK